MLSVLFVILMIGIFGKLIGFAFHAAWGLTKVVCTLVVLPFPRWSAVCCRARAWKKSRMNTDLSSKIRKDERPGEAFHLFFLSGSSAVSSGFRIR